ncbi:MAG: phosphoribosylformylglycinamidine synthase I [Planctomycetes bacterium]|nr:phosphoribosylformylglycinamidine synthase I [Planctomycetota bacterium]
MRKINVLVLRAPGINCDVETRRAFSDLPALTEAIHINRIIEDPGILEAADLIVVPGGFSFGDDIHAGAVLASILRTHLEIPIKKHIERGRLILGICNGFQVLVKAGLLPGLDESGVPRKVTLTSNDSGHYECRWTKLEVATRRSPFLAELPDVIEMPVAHGEGKLVPENDETLKSICVNDQIAFRYLPVGNGTSVSYPSNPSGTTMNIAGILDVSGRVLGLMPHPERFRFPFQHPTWTRREPEIEETCFPIFRGAIRYLQGLL